MSNILFVNLVSTQMILDIGVHNFKRNGLGGVASIYFLLDVYLAQTRPIAFINSCLE